MATMTVTATNAAVKPVPVEQIPEGPAGKVKIGSREELKVNADITQVWGSTSVLCVNFAYLQVASAILAHLFCEIGPQFQDVDPKEIHVFSRVQLILLPLLCWELVYNLYKSFLGTSKDNCLIISRVAIWEILVKISYYTVLAKFNGGFAHVNLRAPGTPRPVYLPRYIGWSFGVPTLLLLTNYPLLKEASFSAIVHRVFPQMAVQWAYCWTCYLGCVVQNPWVGWYLLLLGCVAYVVAVVEQFVLIADSVNEMPNPVPKLFLIFLKEFMFTLYTFVYLFGMWGFMSSLSCETFYSWSDISCKGMTITCLHLFRFLDTDSVIKKD